MPTPHISAKEGSFAKVVLMPGDPLRAKYIADNFLHDVTLVTNIRGMFGFTGYTKNNKKISVMGSGMGMPSIGIYSHELFAQYGVETIIRIGTCGSYQKDIDIFDIIIGTTSSTDSNWPSQYQLGGGIYSAGCDFELAVIARETALENKIPYHAGNILSADVFYNANKDGWKKWEELGVLGVEMESYALYCNAAKLGKKALCILTVSDSFHKKEILTPDQRAFGLNRMINLAIATAEKVA